MKKTDVVSPRGFSGYSMSLLGLFGVGPKFIVQCGNCPATFRERIPLIDDPTLRCSECGVWNQLPLEVGD